MNRDRSEIYTEVQEILVDALGVDDDEAVPEATLRGDLGAESIDFLDIHFRLEKRFGIPIPREELFPTSLTADSRDFVRDGLVTEAGISALRSRLPHADVDAFAADPKVENLPDLFTVQMIVNYLDQRLSRANTAARNG